MGSGRAERAGIQRVHLRSVIGTADLPVLYPESSENAAPTERNPPGAVSELRVELVLCQMLTMY